MRGLISYLRKGVLLSILLFFLSACGHGGGGGAAPPAAPAGVTASPADGKVTLTWDPVAGAASYNVYRAREAGVNKGNYFTLPEGKLYSEATSPLVDQVLTNGAAYYFVVTSVNGAGESAGSAEISAVPTADVALPTVPTQVKATPGDRTVTLEWSASGATSYFVYMAERSGVTRNNWNTISGGKRIQVTSAATTYIQTGLTNGTPYYFVVTSANSLGQSSESKEVWATPFLAATVPAAPANLTASPGDQQITLRWDSAAAAASYRIYWLHPASQPSPCPSAQSMVTVANGTRIDGVTSPYIHNSSSTQITTGLANGETYYYIVTAVNDQGESSPSPQACAVPTPTPPPTAVTLPLGPTDATLTGDATLRGKINPNGFPVTDAYFEWGVSTAYGDQVPIDPAAIGSGTQFYFPSNAVIHGLDPNKFYHYRIVAKNANGPNGATLVSTGEDQRFILPFLGTPQEYPVGSDTSPNDVVIADFDGDRKLDIATANNGTHDISILIQTANQSFGAPTRYPVGTAPKHLSPGDFNGDGRPDLVVSNTNDGTVSLLINTGAGFASAVSYSVWSDPANSAKTFPAGLAVGDFNRDGRPDVAVAVAENGIGHVVVLLGDGTGFSPLSPQNFIQVGTSPARIVAGDFDGDGILDLVVTNTLPTGTDKFALLAGHGDGTFNAAVFYPLPDTNPEPDVPAAAGDFNLDGKLDLAVANNRISTISTLINQGAAVFGPPADMTVGLEPHSVTAADFNSDGIPDLVVPNFRDNSFTIYLAAGDGGFVPSFLGFTGLNPVAAAAGDLDGDGKPDLVVANVSGNSVSVLFGQ